MWPFSNPVEPNIYNVQSDWPKISIVTPSYNQGQFIEETILSVLNQNYPNLEYIIIDGGSTDNTVEIIKKYEDSIKYWISEPDNGQANAINKGFEKCSGEIIGWINSDDYYLEGILFHTAIAFSKNPNIDLVSSNSISFVHESKFIHKDFGRPINKFNLRFGGIIPSHTTFWRKKIHQNIDENIECAIDYELWMRILKPNKTKILNYFGGVFRFQSESKSVQKDAIYKGKWQKDFLYIFDKHNITAPNKIQKWIFHYHTIFHRGIKKILYHIAGKQKSTWPYINNK